MKKLVFIASFVLSSHFSLSAATPTLSADATQICFDGTSYPLLTIASGSGKTSYVSSVINDPTDPVSTKGIYFTAENATSFSLASNNTSVIEDNNITMTLVLGTTYVLKIVPTGVGIAKLTIKSKNSSSSSTSYYIYVAVSAASTNGSNTVFSTDVSDASGAAALDDDYMFIAEDETNVLRMYSRKQSGKSLYSVDITTASGCIDGEELDLEASTKASSAYNSGNRIYWMASLGNGKTGSAKPYRDRVVATDVSGTGADATLSVKSYSAKMRQALIDWGDAQSWDFTASADTESDMYPKRIDGFNIEGLSLMNEGEGAYVGFRAPCVPVKGTAPTASNREYAVMAPVTNFETMMNVSGESSIIPQLGEPVLFDFDELGIRSVEHVGSDKYLIVAGLFEGGGTPAIYLWDGVVPANPGKNPLVPNSTSLIKLPLDLSDLVQPSTDGGVEGHPEALLCEQVGDDLYIHVICDNGSVDYYNSGDEAKDFAVDDKEYPYAKFRTDTYIYNLGTSTMCKQAQKIPFEWCVSNRRISLSNIEEPIELYLYDVNGTIVKHEKVSSSISFDLPVSGVYVLKSVSSVGVSGFKFIIA